MHINMALREVNLNINIKLYRTNMFVRHVKG